MFKDNYTAVKEVALTNGYEKTATTEILKTCKIFLFEASGYTMLCLFAVYFATVLSGELKKSIKYQPQYDVVDNENPSTDTSTSIVLFNLMESCTPVVMYEYKPVVNPDPSRMDVSAIIEMLLHSILLYATTQP